MLLYFDAIFFIVWSIASIVTIIRRGEGTVFLSKISIHFTYFFPSYLFLKKIIRRRILEHGVVRDPDRRLRFVFHHQSCSNLSRLHGEHHRIFAAHCQFSLSLDLSHNRRRADCFSSQLFPRLDLPNRSR